MAIQLTEKFQVGASVERVWSYLIDPEQVVVCLPGASLTEVQDDRRFLGTVKIKVGPVTASYRGKVELTEVDDASHTVRMSAEGMETGGAGSARMKMTSRVAALPEGGSEVVVEQEIEVVGKLAQFGRGMVEEVGKQLFKQFAACARQHLESAHTTEAAPEGAASAPSPTGEPGEVGAPSADTAASTARPPDEAVRGISIFLKALWALITRPFRRRSG